MSSSIEVDTVLVPMQLDAFVLNPSVCGTGAADDTSARICPITQPNYTFLRLSNFLIQSDVQGHADLHSTAPATINSRMTDLGARPEPQPLRHRYGVYVHWTLPRFYRAGVSSTSTVPQRRRRQERLRRGLRTASGSVPEGVGETPEFVEPPTRWMVLRKLDVDSIQPAEARPAFADREYEAWVVESDHLWSLDDIPLDADLQTDLAPFVTGSAADGKVNIEEQAEIFIGRKTPLAEWSGQENANAQPPSISLLRSGNQLFADFQMHNANVFSILDNFEYKEYVDGKANKKYLTYAKASYHVIGWHWNPSVDPLWTSGESVAHGASLDALFMTMQGATQGSEWNEWLEAVSQLRVMCHGAMYDVTWDHDTKPTRVPADEYNARMCDPTQAAVSVGTTPMDALLSYCHARKDQPGRPGDIAKLEEDILAIESLLHARDDGVEEQREAKDSIYNWSFARSAGGSHFHLSGPDAQGGKQPLEPDRETVLKLRELNQVQGLLDACNKTVRQYRWDMFSLWWQYVSDVGNNSDPSLPENEEFKAKTKDLSDRITGLNTRMLNLEAQVDALRASDLLKTAEPASKPVYYRANDPTVLVGGIASGWSTDYLENVSVRAPFHTIAPTDISGVPASLQALSDSLRQRLPEVFKTPADALLAEFHLIRPGGDSGTAGEGKYYPQFHDTRSPDGSWRDQWGDRQPWFPLFVEWETEYTHVPFDYWSLDEHTARLSANELVRYGISVPSNGEKPRPLWEALGGRDTRVLSGRVLILPQPSFSLGAKITQLFQDTPPSILDKYLSEEDRRNLESNVSKLSFLSSPLSGFAAGLVTQAQGSHIKPENKIVGPDGESSSAIPAAVNDNAGLTKEKIELIEGESASTPYAALANFLDKQYCPFKPVTHGQFRFRKFNIIDKFGQTLVPIDQNPRLGGPPPLYPCISDFYEPQTIELDDGVYANTVIKDNPDQCEFVQLPPQINQNGRLNAEFVKRITDDPTSEQNRFKSQQSPGIAASASWRPASEWENPIWGWIITNYADYGIQLFLPDGTFYREVRFGGPLGTLDAPKWLPFSPDDAAPTPETRQLDALVTKLVEPEYLKGFWYMVTTAQEKLPAAPSAYAQFLNSIVGKPLALVNTGWSLELDAPPFVNQSTKSKVQEPERQLTQPETGERPFYQLQIRLGDRDAGYDGLVGYFDTTAPGTSELNLDYIKTFFAPEAGMKPLQRLTTNNYPLFTPFWQPPFPTQPPYGNPSTIADPVGFDDQRNARMSVFGAIVDPFTPVHAYSSFLPASTLLLPSWTWQKAMDAMTAFFHAGPLTLPLKDVPAYDPGQKLTSGNAREMPKRDLPLPSLGQGDWSWFEPYAVEGDGNGHPVYNPFGIEKRGDLTKPGLQDGPYSAIEGFMQLRNPIMMPKPSG
ncbi:hypothetical protein DCS_00099 [Drechmeria coniospora]|uniref:Uncharacterized protein n=1 Tax=Drechmeria coniospora TaxID=98403 RepID=A0A151GPP1_DRECN|nr:hypothetical protein DCS_00099 [Drechmeria coniospora]KYK58972.1 hypothetical protein DCS_00099 [Drechmeria coniospora]